MIRRQSFIQLFVHLGLVILLPGAVASAQAPLCSVVFESKEISLEHIDESLKHLAEMKLEVDLSLARGKLTTIEKQRSNIFQNKLKDLVQLLQGQMSETQVKELLQNKLNEIQGIKDIAQDLEQKRREIEQDQLSLQQVAARIPMPSSLFIEHIRTNYMPASKSVIVGGGNLGGKIYQIDTQTLEKEIFETQAKAYRAHDDQVVVLTSTGEVYRYDALTKNKQPSPFKEPFKDYVKKDEQKQIMISTTGKWIVTMDTYSKLSFFDTVTGKKSPFKFDELRLSLFKKFVKGYREDAIDDSAFISENEMLIVSQFKAVFVYDIITGVASKLPDSPFVSGAWNAQRSAKIMNQGRLGFTNGEYLAVVKADDLKDFKSKATVRKFDKSIDDFIEINNDEILVRFNRADSVDDMVIIDSHTLATKRNLFLQQEEGISYNGYRQMAFDYARNRLFLHGNVNKTNTSFMDIIKNP